ncbi:aspartyl protease family protein At5g10770-like [Tripterygium wilfordii]|uniref:aspartyl protease family protein At5g10770-like n=1 Tax=Tripterygium wilfordii TaxID=458696 RepID=UPI0018F8464F|nr:aspartyl protease family protein At5g10770-like [Tripterygium wilfordii]
MAVHRTLFCCVLIFLCLNERCVCEARGPVGFQGHRYRPFSPSNSHQHIPQDEESRVRSLSFAGDEDGEGLNVPVKELGPGSFCVTVGFGTPRQDLNLFLDTGSDISWIKQCQSCSQSNCHNSQTSIFDTSASSTFSNPCSNSSAKNCHYSIKYNDGSSSDGLWVRDNLTFTSSFAYANFVFGCSVNSSGDFDGADGLLGIGPGRNSLLGQAGNYYGLFCYCLPSSKSSTGYIMFGVLAINTCNLDIENFIPLLENPNGGPPHYSVNLVGITIGQKRLDIEAYMGSSLNIRVDTGTTITRLPGSFHEALKSEFKELMSGYSQTSPLPPLLDTCYDLTGHNNVTVPKMVLHFEGSNDVELDSSAVLWRENESQACLAFAGNENDGDLNIIGGHQQRSLNVYYDVRGKKLAFRKGGC